MPACVFCGCNGKLTTEHVLGNWLSKIGLEPEPVLHRAGPLNRIGHEMGLRAPFSQQVRAVCGDCNNGWMSRLETVAQRVLTPFILDRPGRIEAADTAVIAAWTQKTALTAMLVASKEDRERGYGLPASEYHELYALRDTVQALPYSQIWIGRHNGGLRMSSVRVTPLVVHVDGLPEPNQPQGYTMTIMIGRLLLHGVRFTTPSLQVEASTSFDLPQLWPSAGPVIWPSGQPINDEAFLGFASGKDLRSAETHIELRPWRPATDLPPSQAAGAMIELPAICGKHMTYYPAILVNEAMHGRFYAFRSICECPMSYLIHTEPDGAHCKAAGTAEVISELYDELPGAEYLIQDESITFTYKRHEATKVGFEKRSRRKKL